MAIKRANYFNGEFLKQEDFETEQQYHLDMRRRHNLGLHTPGVVWGLDVVPGAGKVTVAPGLALDARGREIVVEAAQEVQVAAAGQILLRYREDETDETAETGISGKKRVTESFDLGMLADPTDTVVLARVAAAGSPVTLDLAPRQMSGPKVVRDLSIPGSLTVTGGTSGASANFTASLGAQDLSVRNTLQVQGNVILGSADGHAVTVRGTVGSSHSTGRLRIASGTDVTAGGLNVTGQVAVTGNLSVSGTVTLAADPAAPLQAATRQYVDARVLRSGDTMTGALNLPTNGLNVGGGQFAVAGGHVGIGTAAPENAEGWNRVLDMQASGTAKVSMRTGNVEGRVMVHDSGWWNGPAGMVVGTKSNHALTLGTTGQMRMAIDGNGNVGIGTAAPENAEGWNKVLDMQASSHAKLSMRTGLVEGRAMVHDTGFWGSAPGMVVGTRTNHTLTLATNSQKRLTIDGNGNVDHPMWNVHQVLNNAAGALPKQANFNSGGGVLLVFMSGSGFAAGSSQIGMRLLIDGTERGQLRSFTNEASSHKAFVANPLVVPGIAAGNHTLRLEALPGTNTDGNDFFSATVLELPWAQSGFAQVIGTLVPGQPVFVPVNP